METFLAGSVPQLHAKTLVFHVDSFGDEVDADGGLNEGRGTCSFPVKLSKIKRLMMEVLPTDWSPNITILHFTAALPYIFQNYIFYKCDPDH
jgi:hypothetical protein